MNSKEKFVREKFRDSFIHYSHNCLKIKPKVVGNNRLSIIPFSLNVAQSYIHKKFEEQIKKLGYVRAIILKGRQQGATTYVAGRYFWKVTHNKGCQVFILTHHRDATKNIFNMVNRYYKHCHPKFKPQVTISNVNELHFGNLDSGYVVGTAGSRAVGRSNTIQLFHGSEVAHWENSEEHAEGILQAVPFLGFGTELVFESTANGVSNYFFDQWTIAEKGNDTDLIPIFLKWFWQDEYRRRVDKDFELTAEEVEIKTIYGLDNDQINFRRYKIKEFTAGGLNGEKRFCQEYPLNANEAFQSSDLVSYINSNIVMLARKCRAVADGHVLIGVDPARFGLDRTSIAIRQGRVAHEIISYRKQDTMQTVGVIVNLIKKWNPRKVFIDGIGIGAGVFDRLKEMGYNEIIMDVNSSSKNVLNKEAYINKRAEMWGEMKEWLVNTPCQIPDIDSLHSDLCSTGFHYSNSNGALQMESKKIIKGRVRSPDEADALALTFAMPVCSFSSKNDKMVEQFSSTLFARVNKFNNSRNEFKHLNI